MNPERRQRRKEGLFPEYWSKMPKKSIDEIIPEDVSFFEFQNSSKQEKNELDSSSVNTDTLDTLPVKGTDMFENVPEKDVEGPLLFDDELDAKRRHPSDHAFCCSSGTLFSCSIFTVLALEYGS